MTWAIVFQIVVLTLTGTFVAIVIAAVRSTMNSKGRLSAEERDTLAEAAQELKSIGQTLLADKVRRIARKSGEPS